MSLSIGAISHPRRSLALLALVTAGLATCGGGPTVEPLPEHRFDDVPGAVQPYLTRWRIIGPIGWPVGLSAGNLEDLSAVLDAPAASWERTLIADPARPAPVERGLLRTVSDVGGEMRLHQIFPRFEHQVAFATTQIISPLDAEAALLVEADDAVRVWVNGEAVHSNPAVRRLQQFDDYVRIRLRRGTNTILLKLIRGRSRGGSWDSWSFAAGPRSLRGAREERASRTVLQEVQTSLVGPHQKVLVDLRLHPSEAAVDVLFRDPRGSVVKQIFLPGGRLHMLSIDDLPDGLYYSQVRQSSVSEAFPVYKGRPEDGIRELLPAVDQLRSDSTHAANLAALEKRFTHLHKPEHLKPHDLLWQAKVVQVLAALWSIRDALARGQAPFRDVTGTHLRGIRSRIDGADQYYLLHVPRGYRRSDGPLPLVLIQPYKFETLRPFLESIPVAEISVLGMLGRIADRTGMAFLWMDNRGNTSGSDLGEVDMFDAVEQVARDYAIDRERLYLFGSCAGGREALSLAAKYPDRFAAVGTMSPTSAYRPYAPETATDPFGEVAYRQKTPLVRMENLQHVPIYAFHGDQNTHNPLWESQKLKEAADEAGVDFNLNVVRGATHLRFPVEPRSLIFDWFKGRRRMVDPDHIVFSTSSLRYSRAYWLKVDRLIDSGSDARIEAAWRDGELHVESRNVAAFRVSTQSFHSRARTITIRTNGVVSFSGRLDRGPKEIRVTVAGPPPSGRLARKSHALPGPLWDVFTGPALVVIGTGGSPGTVAAAKADAERLSSSWRQRFLGQLPVKTDIAVSTDDIRQRHVLLFGQPNERSPLGRLGDRLPFRVVNGKLQPNSGTSYRDPAAVQFVVPNPANPRRYLAGILNPAGLSIPTDAVQLALKGWYDYSVWSSADGRPVLKDAGMFDEAWSHLISKVLPVADVSTP